MRLHDFTTLTFDVYGTLIDWEAGILAALQPWLASRGARVEDEALLAEFARIESRWEKERPRMLYPELLAHVHGELSEFYGVTPDAEAAAAFGRSVGDWPPFADSRESLHYLARHFRLVVLSNVDRASLERSAKRLDTVFDLRFTAEDIGSYKPSPANFDHLLAHVGEEKGRVLHVAQSLFHDHVPCARAGLASAWIDRRHGRSGSGATLMPQTLPQPAFTFPSLEAFCEAHRAEAGGRS